MANYEGENCSKCGKPFRPGDDIVVCPDCGAPYHRACAKELKQCVYFDKHGTDEAYKSKEQRDRERAEAEAAEAKKVDGRGELRCSRCGTMNSPDGLFCEVCGTPLKKQVDGQQAQNQRDQDMNRQTSFYGPGSGGIPFNTIPYNPYTTPFGGLNPDEEIEDIPVKDLAIFLGQNSHYFLPRFKQMKERNSNSWNWSAFLLTHYYLFYRKINWLGVLMFVLSMVLSIPMVCSYYDTMLHAYSPNTPAIFDQQMLFLLGSVANLFNIGIRFFLGMFANRIYMNQVFRKIRKLKQEFGNTPEYHSMLVKNGSVSIGLVIAAVALTVVMYFAVVFVMISIML